MRPKVAAGHSTAPKSKRINCNNRLCIASDEASLANLISCRRERASAVTLHAQHDEVDKKRFQFGISGVAQTNAVYSDVILL